MKQEVRTRTGKLIGFITKKNDKELVAWSALRVKLGTYNIRENKTRDQNNKLIAHGNLLATLFVI